MGEDDRQRSILGPHLADRERHTVGRGHHASAVGVEQLEVLARCGSSSVTRRAATAPPWTRRAPPTADSPASARQPALLRHRQFRLSRRRSPNSPVAADGRPPTRPRGLVTTS